MVKNALCCHVNIYCADKCPGGAPGYAYCPKGGGHVHVCLDKNKIKNDQQMAYMLLHELVHASGCTKGVANKAYCKKKSYEGSPPVIPEPKPDPKACNTCKKWERAAYKKSCAVFHRVPPNYRVGPNVGKDDSPYAECIRAGICYSCKRVCPQYQGKECPPFPKPTRPPKLPTISPKTKTVSIKFSATFFL